MTQFNIANSKAPRYPAPVRIDPTRPLRPVAHTWIAAARLGNSALPHIFSAARCTWILNRDKMQLHEIELAIVQSVPDGRIQTFLDHLDIFDQRITLKEPARKMIMADVSRSIEITPALWRKTPDVIPVLIVPGGKDDWAFPHYVIGRPLLMSRMQLMISDKKFAFALPANEDDDPNIWNTEKVRSALSSITARAAKFDEAEFIHEDEIAEDVALTIALIIWWAEAEIPGIYEDAA